MKNSTTTKAEAEAKRMEADKLASKRPAVCTSKKLREFL
jgi:hypothetical protein